MKRTLQEHALRHSIDKDELLRLLHWEQAKVWPLYVSGVYVSDVYEDEDVEKALAAGVLASLGVFGR